MCRSAIFKITPENVDLLDRDIGNIDRHTSTEECCKMSGNFTVPGEGHCGACRKTWRLTDTDLCPRCEIQMMSHIVESCPLTKLNGEVCPSCTLLLLSGCPVMDLNRIRKKKKLNAHSAIMSSTIHR